MPCSPGSWAPSSSPTSNPGPSGGGASAAAGGPRLWAITLPLVTRPTSRVRATLERALVRGLFALPDGARRRLGVARPSTAPALAPDALLLLRLAAIRGADALEQPSVGSARAQLAANAALARGAEPLPVASEDRLLPAPWGDLPARLYIPRQIETPSPLLVYFHGGGWVLGSVDTHDDVARRVAHHAGVRVLSVDYRLAPEHPYPAAVEDAELAFAHVATEADRFGADPTALAVGGDSAGGNLAAVVAQRAQRAGGPTPVFQLLFYPVCDAPRRHPSYDAFSEGYYLTAADMDWFARTYAPDPTTHADPDFAPLRAASLTGLPSAYIATSAADPLRDEGEAYAARLREAGVIVALRREPLLHGFANTTVAAASRAAVAVAAGALRQALAAAAGTAASDPG